MRSPTSAKVCAILLALAACSEPVESPNETEVETPEASAEADELLAHRGGRPSSTVRWNRESTELYYARKAVGPAPNFGRINTYLALAQYRAVRAARDGWHHGRRASLAGAAAGASVVVLKQFYPLDVVAIDAEFSAQRAEYAAHPRKLAAFDEGDAIGRSAAATTLAEAATDNFGLATLPAQPVGPGYWVSSGAAIVKGGYGARPFVLKNGDEINSPPPPAFGSTTFLEALAVVRGYSDARTPEQTAITVKWVPFSAPLFSDKAADLIDRHYRGEVEAAKVFAYGNVAAYDAIIGCFHTKFTWWYIRPTQADPGITLATGLPNHPSYPSGHSCQSGGWEGVLVAFFPSDRRAIRAMAEEASLSRIVGGLHYTFDGNAGLELGRKAARLTLKRGVH